MSLPDLTQFAQFRSSFQVPTRQEEMEIKAAIHESSKEQRDIEDLLLQVKDVKTALHWFQILAVHRKLQSELRGMISPLRILPPEILSNIFLMCLPRSTAKDVSISMDSPPWTLARVCQKWRQVSHSTPSLWAHIPSISLDGYYKPGFFELFRTMIDLSFPTTLALQLDGTRVEMLQDFAHILPRIHSLRVHLNDSLVDAFVQRKESFNALKIALISFSPGQHRRRIDFLSTVSDLFLFSVAGDYQFIPMDFQWPNLTSFRGTELPATFFRQLLSVAPLLQKVVMTCVSIPAADTPSSVVWHTKLKTLEINLADGVVLRPWLVDIHLPSLEGLSVSSVDDLPPFISFLQHTKSSLVKLTVPAPRPFVHQRAFYASCPRLEELTLFDATDDDLKSLTFSTDCKPCPSLRHLRLSPFNHTSDSPMDGLREFLFSRDLVPFNAPRLPPSSRSLESVSLYIASETSSNFHRHCLKVGDDAMKIIKGWEAKLKYVSTFNLVNLLPELTQVISSETPYVLVFFENFEIMQHIENFVKTEGTCSDALRDAVMHACGEWTSRVEEILRFPHWKTHFPGQYRLQATHSATST